MVTRDTGETSGRLCYSLISKIYEIIDVAFFFYRTTCVLCSFISALNLPKVKFALFAAK